MGALSRRKGSYASEERAPVLRPWLWFVPGGEAADLVRRARAGRGTTSKGAAPGRVRRPRGVRSAWSPRATAGQRRTTACVLPSTRAPSNVTVRSTRTVPASPSIAPTVPVTSSVATPGLGTGTGRVNRVW
ncbi:Uncharacterised protein [Mycobacteroides abscessus]|nr:Uncharacterised protein [Mycobacteroides abscessus]